MIATQCALDVPCPLSGTECSPRESFSGSHPAASRAPDGARDDRIWIRSLSCRARLVVTLAEAIAVTVPVARRHARDTGRRAAPLRVASSRPVAPAVILLRNYGGV